MTDLTKILTIAGRSGLFLNIGQNKSGLIVESLLDGKRFPVFSYERISSLSDIRVFTINEDLPLKDVLLKIKEKFDGKPAISPASQTAELRKFMEDILPEYDRDRVYPSDIKKIVSWYNLLAEKNMLDFAEEHVEEKHEADGTHEPAEENSQDKSHSDQ